MPPEKGKHRLQQEVDKAVHNSQREAKQREREYQQLVTTKKGADPSQPWHPVFNPDPADTLRGWVEEEQRRERKRFEPEWSGVIAGIKAGRFRDRKAISEETGKPYDWGPSLCQMAVKQGVLTQADLKACFKGKAVPAITAHRKARSLKHPVLSREQFEKIFETRGLTFETATALLRLGAWTAVSKLSEDFEQSPAWANSLRVFLMRDGWTVSEWRRCFKPTNWKRAAAKWAAHIAYEQRGRQ